MTVWIAGTLILFGVALQLLSAVGLVRLPDVFARMHASTKASSLGLALILVGVLLLEDSGGTRFKLALAVLFQLATAPVAAHALGRAAYRRGVERWEGTWLDELEPHYARRRGPDAGADA